MGAVLCDMPMSFAVHTYQVGRARCNRLRVRTLFKEVAVEDVVPRLLAYLAHIFVWGVRADGTRRVRRPLRFGGLSA
jgi:hypothetical protein